MYYYDEIGYLSHNIRMEETTMEEKKLVKVTEGKILAGVCTGLAAYFKIDAWIVRIIFILLACAGSLGAWGYLIAYFVMGKAE